jgi:hypothetical protein
VSERKLISPEDALICSIDDALRETSLGVLRFLELEAERRGWRCGYRARRQAYQSWVDPNRPHAFDARALGNVVRIVGHAEWLAPLLALEARVIRERRGREIEQHERPIPARPRRPY